MMKSKVLYEEFSIKSHLQLLLAISVFFFKKIEL